jgi:hypothetical protein
MVEGSTEMLRATGLTVLSVITDGDPKQLLPEEAEHWKADCIFVGARGLRRIERFLLGSVSAAVAAQAHCSVEVIRAGQKTSSRTVSSTTTFSMCPFPSDQNTLPPGQWSPRVSSMPRAAYAAQRHARAGGHVWAVTRPW